MRYQFKKKLHSQITPFTLSVGIGIRAHAIEIKWKILFEASDLSINILFLN